MSGFQPACLARVGQHNSLGQGQGRVSPLGCWPTWQPGYALTLWRPVRLSSQVHQFTSCSEKGMWAGRRREAKALLGPVSPGIFHAAPWQIPLGGRGRALENGGAPLRSSWISPGGKPNNRGGENRVGVYMAPFRGRGAKPDDALLRGGSSMRKDEDCRSAEQPARPPS